MEDQGDPHFKRERPVYGQHPPLHMPPTEGPPHLHNYHHSTPQSAQMPQPWNPAPSPYNDGNDHRPPPTDGAPSHHAPPSYAPQQNAYPPPPPSHTPTYPPDTGYSRHNSTSGPPTRSPPSVQPVHYPPPVNGGPPPSESYYRQDYRPQYPPTESPANTHPQPALHVQTTNHEMMPAQAPPHGPPPGYPPSQSAGPPPTPHYWAAPPGAYWDAQQRRKPVRAAQACDSCRQRKAKCDEGRPECTHCKENGLRCTYRDVPPQKSEKQMLQMGEKVDALSDKLESHISATEEKLDSLLSTVRSLAEGRALDRPAGSVAMVKTTSRPQAKEEARSDSRMNYNSHEIINAPFMQGSSMPVDQVPHTVDGNESQSATKTRGPMGASDLLNWPAIRELAPKDIPATYVMDGELERGLLRLYGCGEGEDKGDGHDGVPSPAASSSSGRMEEETSTASPSGVWGTGQFPAREAGLQPIYDHAGGVTPDGQLLLDRKAVDQYVKSYLDRMHILHPFLDPRVLRKMVHAFKMKHSWDYSNYNRLAQSVGIGSKRKRETSESPGSLTEEPPLHRIPHHSNGHHPMPKRTSIEHSVSNAIILLVMALGKICAYDKPLPGPPKSSNVPAGMKSIHPQPLLGYADLPPMQVPPSSAPTSPYTPITNGIVATPVTSALHGKNMDVIPGLAYFAKAADILGELPGGVDVSHIQANLLAGLYMGQLARIIPSHWYIANACRACQILIRSADYKENKMPAERRNLINFAFWSCLQLESDILAEMDIPSSGIIHKEYSMLLEVPNALTIADPDKEPEESPRTNPQEFLRHYSNQIQLRRTINDAVHNIYSTAREHSKPPKLVETVTENLESWRQLLRDWDWDEHDHESTDINHARMRGKYYGAKYIINRPALHYALSVASPGTPMSQPSQSPLGGLHSDVTSSALLHQNNSMASRKVSEMRPPPRAYEPLEDWILQACKKCIDAAIKSTTAFDNVPQRLVITNILGTAHAQFGNVLVLAATFNSSNPQLRSMVPEDKLRYLLGRTIKFLEERRSISPALAEDARILRHVQTRLFPSIGPPVSASTSFSSAR